MKNENNIFTYATSELSQDAFICYLLSFAMEKFKDLDKELTKCAKALLRLMVGDRNSSELKVLNLKRQYKNIDVLVELVDGTSIIIEDKTFSSAGEGQLNRYKQALLEEGRKENAIYCVYYKIGDQAHPEPDVINITRFDLMKLFKQYPNSTNIIYNNYVEHLDSIELDTNAFLIDKDNAKWRQNWDHVYRGFFTHLIHNKIVTVSGGPENYDWYYVANKSGGFWCLWWNVLSTEEMSKMGIDSKYADAIYLQIEDNYVAVKLSKKDTENYEITRQLRWDLFRYFEKEVPGFSKMPFKKGQAMTVGRVQYDMTDYKEKIKTMENTINTLVSEFRFEVNR